MWRATFEEALQASWGRSSAGRDPSRGWPVCVKQRDPFTTSLNPMVAPDLLNKMTKRGGTKQTAFIIIFWSYLHLLLTKHGMWRNLNIFLKCNRTDMCFFFSFTVFFSLFSPHTYVCGFRSPGCMCLLNLDMVLGAFGAQRWQCYLCKSPKKNNPDPRNVKQHASNHPTKRQRWFRVYSQHRGLSVWVVLRQKQRLQLHRLVEKSQKKMRWRDLLCHSFIY